MQVEGGGEGRGRREVDKRSKERGLRERERRRGVREGRRRGE